MAAVNRKFMKMEQIPKAIGRRNITLHYERKSGFTLIELLVVIAIIALLLSILMPALTKAKNQAMRVICKSQQHQAGLGIVMYASENNSKLSIGNFYNYPIANWGDSNRNGVHHESRDDGFIGSDIQSYLSSEDLSIFLCPANKTVRQRPAFFVGGDTRGMSTYEWYKSGNFNYDGPNPGGGNFSYFIYYYYLGNYAWENNNGVSPPANHLTFEERSLKAKGLIYPEDISGPRAKVMQDVVTDENPYDDYKDSHKYPNALYTDGSVDSLRISDLEPRPRMKILVHYW
jgi:prepilin-type N-terminal cleavage/methylation domain-containing protein